jgi:hypothetical protein
MQNSDEKKSDAELLGLALGHVSHWHEYRLSNGLQVLNYFLVASAILATAYVSAINDKLNVIAGMISLLGVAVSGASYFAGKQQRDIALLAMAPYRVIQGRLADALGIDSLRIIERADEYLQVTRHRQARSANLIFPLAATVSVLATIYAWLIK